MESAELRHWIMGFQHRLSEIQSLMSENPPNAGYFLRETIEDLQNTIEECLLTILERSVDHIFIVDRSACDTPLDADSLQEAGFTLPNLLGFGEGIFYADEAEFYQVQYRRVFSTGRPVTFERGIHVSGGLRWCSVSLNPMRDNQGNVAALTGLSRNVSERKQIEQALKVSEDKFQGFVKKASEGMVLMDETGGIIEWNEAMGKITGMRRAQVLGQAIWDVAFVLGVDSSQTPEKYERLESAFLDLFRAGDSRLLERPLKRKIHSLDGTRKIVRIEAFSISTSRGTMAGCVVNELQDLHLPECVDRQPGPFINR